MGKKLNGSVVVITGASSGIGRAAALAFAEEGSTVVLGARRENALQEVARECGTRGVRTLVVPTDVTDEGAVQHLAGRAVETFGRIDVWVNNAAVSAFGRFEEMPSDVFRRVLETNLFGYVHGARAALPIFREQGRGVLILNDSVVGSVPQPHTSAYVTSKYAIRGFAECLRMELSLDQAPDIHVCTVMPASIDTPLFQQSANFTGRQVKPLDPTYPAGKVADAIVSVAKRPRREVMVGGAGRMAVAFHAVAPGMYEKTAARQVDRDHLEDRPADRTWGNLWEPMPEYARVSGGWRPGPNRNGPTGKAALAAAAVAVPALFWSWRTGRLSSLLG
jgi:NAD(P)-dependent dehydrogenase (short-subunit alcohol dehydrogenase family)